MRINLVNASTEPDQVHRRECDGHDGEERQGTFEEEIGEGEPVVLIEDLRSETVSSTLCPVFSSTKRSACVERGDAPEEFGARVRGTAETQVRHEFPIIIVGGRGDVR